MAEEFNINPDVIDRLSSREQLEPFADDFSGAPFIDDSLKLSLNKLLHLVPYSAVLLVTGAEGVGKTTLLKNFIDRASETWRAVNISSSVLISGEEFLRQVIQGLGLPYDSNDRSDDQLWEIGRHLQSVGRSGRRAIVIIDDAHMLSAEVGRLIEKILNDNRVENALSVLFSIDADQEQCLDDLAVVQERIAYTLRLEPLSEAGVAGYISHRLAGSGRSGDEVFFTPDVISDIYRQTNGLPGQINDSAQLVIAKAGGAVSAGSSNIMRWALVAAGVAVAVVLFLQNEINELVELPAEQAVVEDISTPVEGMKMARTKGDKITVESDATMAQASKSAIERPVPEAKIEVAATKPAEPESLPVPAKSEEKPELGALPEDQVIVAEAVVPKVPPVAKAQDMPEAKPHPELESEPIEKVEEVKIPSPQPVAEPRQESKPDSLSPEMAWLTGQESKHFTLQLMALRDEVKVRNFIKKQKLKEQIATFHITRKSHQLTVLVYGSYPSRVEADEAAKALPKSWGVGQPWVRSFESVNQDL
jgi:DamX protein